MQSALPPSLSGTELRALKPSARSLYWYLRATHTPQSLTEVAAISGIPRQTIYQMLSEYPGVFRMTAKDSTITWQTLHMD